MVRARKANRCWTATNSGPAGPSVCGRRSWSACRVCAYFTLHFPVHQYFTAVRRHENPDLPGPAETHLAVTRRNFVVRHYELSRPAYQMLSALLAGASLEEALAEVMAAAEFDLDQLSNSLWTWFRDWAAEGFFRAIVSAPYFPMQKRLKMRSSKSSV